MSIKRKMYREGRYKFERFEDLKAGLFYRRIYCGFAWPFSASAAFICVLAEDFKPDHSLPHSPRHLRILDEFESSNLEALHRRCREIKEEFKLKNILGIDDTPFMRFGINPKGQMKRFIFRLLLILRRSLLV